MSQHVMFVTFGRLQHTKIMGSPPSASQNMSVFRMLCGEMELCVGRCSNQSWICAIVSVVVLLRIKGPFY